ncbi:MAG: hypothetical protein BWY69_01514 [Planctomycetes bacterium ADurb.Bin401]|nr:MAG: hypothetical protein BWY69_01514 [Planctomycetes bacterium ADurb.Bin401]
MAFVSQHFRDLQSHIEVYCFLIEPIITDGARVFTAVSRIDDDCFACQFPGFFRLWLRSRHRHNRNKRRFYWGIQILFDFFQQREPYIKQAVDFFGFTERPYITFINKNLILLRINSNRIQTVIKTDFFFAF